MSARTSTLAVVEQDFIPDVLYRTVFETINEGVVVLDRSGHYVATNTSASRILGLTTGQLLGREPFDTRWRAIHEDGRPFAIGDHPAIRTLRTGQPAADVIMGIFKPDGTLIWISIRAQLISEPGTPLDGSVMTAFIDVTAMKEAERQLARKNDELAAKIGTISLLQAQLLEQAIRDSLTGLHNRRYFDETLPREVAHAIRNQHPVCIAMADIDCFKRINDTYGHQAGDEMIRQFSEILQSSCRAGDLICRYGGEEFVIVMSETALGDAKMRAEQIREKFAALTVSHCGKEISTTVSIGIAVLPEDGNTAAEIVRAADTALYHAKGSGRNCVVIYTP